MEKSIYTAEETQKPLKMIQPQSSDQEQCHISAEASFTPPSTVTYSIFPSFCPPVSHSVGAFKRRKMVLLQGMSMLIWKEEEEEDFLFCFLSLRLTFSNADDVSAVHAVERREEMEPENMIADSYCCLPR